MNIIVWRNYNLPVQNTAWVARFFLLLNLITFSGATWAGTISNVPLYLATQTIPNVFFELDDSGSMDWTILAKNYWTPCAYDPDSGNDNNNSADCGAFLTRGNMYSYGTR
ncbi:hypothetical protein CCP3SC1_1000010 [Gammaproteobacteria bacterium]